MSKDVQGLWLFWFMILVGMCIVVALSTMGCDYYCEKATAAPVPIPTTITFKEVDALLIQPKCAACATR